MKKTMLAVLAAILLAGPAWAQERSYEDRFHEAYVAEVIEGEIGGAAKEYLALMSDDGAPAGIRAEARFRFAVTAVLLGRPDEARIHLDALAADPKIEADLKTRVAAYRRSIDDLTTGSALDEKMKELVFELGRADPWEAGVPLVYRDFEIIGRPAIPFLERLLDHPDLTLRRNAFRMLVRMETPGIFDRWSPEIGFPGINHSFAYELAVYLKANPAAIPQLERGLLGAHEDGGAGVVSKLASQGVVFSETFIRELSTRDKGAQGAIAAARVLPNDVQLRLLVEWLRSENRALASGAADALHMAWPALAPPGELFPNVVELAFLQPGFRPASHAGALRSWAAERPTEEVLGLLHTIFRRVAEDPRHEVAAPLLGGGVLEALSAALEPRLGEADVRSAYAAALLRWLDVLDVVVPRAERERWGHLIRSDRVVEKVKTALLAMPEDEAVEFARSILAGPPAAHRTAVLDPVTEEEREPLARRALAVLPPILAQNGAELSRSLYGVARAAMQFATPDEAVRMVYAVGKQSDENAVSVLLMSLPSTVLAEVLPRLESIVDLGLLIELAARGSQREPAEFAPFLLKHIRHPGSQKAFRVMMMHPDLFPPRQVVPQMHHWNFREDWVTPEEAVEIARDLTADPAAVNEPVLRFIGRFVPAETAAEIAGRLFRTAPVDVLALVHSQFGNRAPPEAIYVALERVMAEDPPKLHLAATLVRTLVNRAPSPELFLAIETLIASEDQAIALPGIAAAASLGREELLPALAKKLDSLDASIRTQAKQAMDSILELRKLKEETRARIFDDPPRPAGGD